MGRVFFSATRVCVRRTDRRGMRHLTTVFRDCRNPLRSPPRQHSNAWCQSDVGHIARLPQWAIANLRRSETPTQETVTSFEMAIASSERVLPQRKLASVIPTEASSRVKLESRQTFDRWRRSESSGQTFSGFSAHGHSRTEKRSFAARLQQPRRLTG